MAQQCNNQREATPKCWSIHKQQQQPDTNHRHWQQEKRNGKRKSFSILLLRPLSGFSRDDSLRNCRFVGVRVRINSMGKTNDNIFLREPFSHAFLLADERWCGLNWRKLLLGGSTSRIIIRWDEAVCVVAADSRHFQSSLLLDLSTGFARKILA